jgi:hypothetical protein
MIIPQRWEQSQIFKCDVKRLNMLQTVDGVQHCRTEHVQIYSRMFKTPSATLHE